MFKILEQNRVAIAVLLALLVNVFDRQILALVNWPQAFINRDYAILAKNCFDTLVLVAALRWFGGVSFAGIWRSAGLAKPIRASIVWTALLFVPAVIVMLALGHIDTSVSPSDIFYLGLLFPMFEEVQFRGLCIGGLMLFAGWRLWQSALIPSLFFGLAHALQGQSLVDAAMLAAITGAGGLLGGWLYARWDYNLWPPFFLHAGLNTLWMIFALGDNAIGSYVGNGLRVVVVACAIALSLWALDWLRRTAGEKT